MRSKMIDGTSKKKRIAALAFVAAAVAMACMAVGFACLDKSPAYAADDAAASSSSSSQINSVEDLAGKRVGAVVGTVGFEAAGKYCGADGEALGFNTTADLIQALAGDKIDAYIVDGPIAKYTIAGKDNFKIAEGDVGKIQYGFMFPLTGSDQYLNQMNEFLEKAKASGLLDEIWQRWWGTDESAKVVDYESLNGTNGTLRFATSTVTGPPNAYVKDGEFAGVDIDIITAFCKEYGYQLEITDTDTAGTIAALSSGKADIGGFGTTITEERAKSVRFSQPFYDGGMVAVVKSGEAAEVGFFESLAAGFQRTFIDEDRWAMFVDGALTTLAISILSILFGTILGFLVFLLVRKGGKVSNKIVDFCIWLISGMPTVVLLMVFFYIVFADVAIDGAIVAIVAFTLVFAASTIGMLRVGENAVDGGQIEAARALGYSDGRAFKEVVLPQTIRHILPTYQAETITLLKGTAVVGYIAVRDLTKVGDIIRSATYDAIFPLIAVAIVYFVLEACIKRLVRFAEKKMTGNGKHAGGILKGVKQEEQPIHVYSESDEKVFNLDTAQALAKGTELIRFEDVGKKFGDCVVMEHVNTTINVGDVIAIIGPSGCGKSTIMRAINLLGPATSGKVFFKGEDIMAPGYDTKKLYKEVGMVFQRWNLFEHWTIVENLMRPQMDLCGTPAQHAYDVAMAQLRLMGLRDKAFSYPSELSGGQQQRIAIMRAFVTNPSVVLMDEPTSALDPRMVGEIKEILLALAGIGKTMIIVSHDMKFSRAVCNRVFYLDDKGIYEDGTPDQIFNAPQRPKTRDFIMQVESLKIDLTSDNPETAAAYADIENYLASQYADSAISLRMRRFFKLVVEDAILPALPDPFAVNVVVAYDGSLNAALLTVWYSGERHNPLENDALRKRVIADGDEDHYKQVSEGAYTNRIDVFFYEK